MKERLLMTTAVGLMLGTAAFAQSPNEQPRTSSPPAAQSQSNPSSTSTSTPAASSPSSTSPSSTPSAQNTQSTTPPKSATTTSQSAPNTAGTNDSSRSQAQSNQTSPSAQGKSDNNTAAPSQAQSAQPSNTPNQAQTNTSQPANNQAQSAPANTNNPAGANNANNNAGTQPNNQTNTAQSRSSNVNVSANLNETQRTRVTESLSKLSVRPLTNVNFSLSVGTAVPRDVRFEPLPVDVVEVMPQYRGYNFAVVRDEVVIVDPSTYQIVDVIPRSGRAAAAAPAPARTTHKTVFSDKDREVIRKHARTTRTEQRTTGSATSTHVRVGDRLPDSVEIRSFPDEVYRESPTLREYRYIERDDRTYVVEPHERTILEEID